MIYVSLCQLLEFLRDIHRTFAGIAANHEDRVKSEELATNLIFC